MKAAYIEKTGSPASIHYGDLGKPKLSLDEVLVKNHYSAVNYVDTFVRSGQYKTLLPQPFIIGRDAVGQVVEKGDWVTAFDIGDWVWTNSMGHDGRQGVAAEYFVAPVNRVYPLPQGTSPLKAIASVHSAATAAILLTKVAQAKLGQSLLVCGGNGHVGSKLVAIGQQMGLDVTATAAPKALKEVRALGAKAVYDYHEDQQEALSHRFDMVVDTSGQVPLKEQIAALRQGGKILMITPPPVEDLNLWSLYTQSAQILGFVISQASALDLQAASQVINKLFAQSLLLNDDIEVLPLSQAKAAHERLEQKINNKKKLVLKCALD